MTGTTCNHERQGMILARARFEAAERGNIAELLDHQGDYIAARNEVRRWDDALALNFDLHKTECEGTS